ncbi:hypothetical protein [Oceaniradius stylonematis]|uniref:hypothetical protein n=1 Tax=Oceaniradius stylonematis TaxID=2184161 RepID=UPI003B59C798
MTQAPYSMAGAAARLGVSRRQLQTIIKRHPHYYANGNRKLFTEGDIGAIMKGLRDEARVAAARKAADARAGKDRSPCRSSSRTQGRAKPRSTPSGERTVVSMSTEARKLAAEIRRKSSSTGSATRSTVHSFPGK